MEEDRVEDESGCRIEAGEEHWQSCSNVGRVLAWVAWRPRKRRSSCLFFFCVLALLPPLFFAPLHSSCLLFDAAAHTPVCGAHRKAHASFLSPRYACSSFHFLSSRPPSVDASPSRSFLASASSGVASVRPPARSSLFSFFPRSPSLGPSGPFASPSFRQSTFRTESRSPLFPSVSASAPSLPSAFLFLSCLSSSPRLRTFSLPVSKGVCFLSLPWWPASANPPFGGLPPRTSRGFKRAAREPVDGLSSFAQRPQTDGSIASFFASRTSPSSRRPRPPPAAALRNLAAGRDRTGGSSEGKTHRGKNRQREKEIRERRGEKGKKDKASEGDSETPSDGEKKERKRRRRPKTTETREERRRALKASSERSGAEDSGVTENGRSRIAGANEERGEIEGRRTVGRRNLTKARRNDGEDESTGFELASLPREPARDKQRSGAKTQSASGRKTRRTSTLPSRKREKARLSTKGNGRQTRTCASRRQLPKDAAGGRRSEELAERGRETPNAPEKFHLVLVESPAKAKTIEKFLRDQQARFLVRATRGHVRQLQRRSGEPNGERQMASERQGRQRE
uniref:DNA topoisomerase domain-containing protein n=1 Tax=Toxoplasma gondii COUG TaxID=1074873 RepID=A0A2G8XQP1_TOXGO|nr:DNA topoisomerase domain-containing protein [Toxoplasma gondii COUG]